MDSRGQQLIKQLAMLLVFACLALASNFASSATLVRQINSGSDDAEEAVNAGTVNTTSTDLEINYDGGEPQLVGMSFEKVGINQGSTICSNTYLQFEADGTRKQVTTVIIYADDVDDANDLDKNDGDLSNRTPTSAQVTWSNIPAWTDGNDYQSPSIQSVIQEIISRGGWSNDNQIVMLIKGGGGRRAAVANDGNGEAPILHIEYDNGSGCGSPATEIIQIDKDDQDSVENVTTNQVDEKTDTLELVHGGGTAQLVGLRFTNITIPSGSTINSASIQFTTDEIDADPTSTTIFGIKVPNTPTFTTATNNISSRTRTIVSTPWNNIPNWSTVGQAGVNQKTPDIKALVQSIVNQGSWASGNAMGFVFRGWGERTAESYNGSTSQAPVLTIDYTTSVPGEANIGVSKTDSVDPVPTNTNYNYTMTVSNAGPEDATAVTLTDVIPAALTFISVFTDQGTCTHSSGTINCSLGTILNGGTVTVTLFVKSPALSQTVNNTATINASSADSLTGDNSNTEETTIGGNTEQLCYIFSDANNSLSLYDTAAGTVNDFASNGTNVIEAIAWDSANELLYGADAGQFGRLSTVNGSWTPIGTGFGTASGSLGNIALTDVDGMAFNAFNGTNVMYGVHERAGADLLFQINIATGTFVTGAFAGNDYVPLGVISGNNITDDIAIDATNGQMFAAVNNGGSTDRLVKINKTTGAATDIALVTIADVEGLGSDPDGQLWGSSGTRDTVFEIDKATGIGSNERALNFGDNEAVDCVGVSPTVSADLVMNKIIDNDTPDPAENIVYTVTLTNSGAANATGVQVFDDLPAQITYVSHTASQGIYDDSSGYWLIGSINSGNSVTLNITATVTSPLGTNFTNTASVSAASQPDANTANNTASATATVSQPVLMVVKMSSGATVNPGQIVTYTVVITNTGNEAATNVVIDDDLPDFTAFGFHTFGDTAHFNFTEGGTPSGLTLGTQTFDDGTTTYSYAPPTGPTVVYDPAVTDFKVLMDGAMDHSGASFSVQYSVQVDGS